MAGLRLLAVGSSAGGNLRALSEDPVTTDTQTPVTESRPPQRRSGIDPRRIRRWVVRLTLVGLIVTVLLFSWWFGVLRVPVGMDGLSDILPPSVCLIDKRESSVLVGSAVFVDLPAGGTVLSRVVELSPDGQMRLENDNPDSVQPDSNELGLLPLDSLRGVVLVVFAGQGPPGELVRDK